MTINYQAAQGDCLISVSELPHGATLIPNDPNHGPTIAYGEATGHAHSFRGQEDRVKIYAANDNTNRKFIVIEGDKPATLFHHEHTEIKFNPGIWVYNPQREWSDDEEPIAVRD